jgi:aspartyl-tRNA(Asn)/glutamyl-tRNA(Gln) amidotransferase subunit B
MNYETVIGLEIHIQLNTKSKTFCSCSTEFGAPPNTHTCPVCLGLPGALPVLNEEVVRKGVAAGLALNASVEYRSIFARKNYFYPDLPKAYQISQYEFPINSGGRVKITSSDGKEKYIRITRAHLEEDAGKLVHDENPQGPSYVDLNRCGVPLLEIVTEPDIRDPEEAYQFLVAIKEIMQYAGVSECNMEKGELRVDVNISLRKMGDNKLGVKQEIKNMNSFANVKRALEFEVKRQSKLLKSGEKLVQQTRLFDVNKNATVPMRSKEEAHDYRYFPDPDLVPMVLTEGEVTNLREALPELPEPKRARFIETYGLTQYDAANICSSVHMANYFEEAVQGYGNPKKVANWMLSEFMRYLNEQRIGIDQSPVTPAMLRELFDLIDEGVISGKIAKEVFTDMMSSGNRASVIVEKRGLKQLTDEGALEAVVLEVISENGHVVEEFRSGKQKAFGFLVGQVMKKTKGRANPKLANRLLKEKIGGGHDVEQ